MSLRAHEEEVAAKNGAREDGMCLTPEAFALQHFGRLDLGDQRRNARAVRIAAAMTARPDASIPQQMGGVHQAKAAYRFFSRNDMVTFDSLSSQHHQQTRERLGKLSRVLLIGDGTELDYSHHPATGGLAKIGDWRGRGFSLHSVLAIDPQRQILGLAYQNLFHRYDVDKTETRTQRSRRDRESLVWSKSVEALASPPPGCEYIYINDRASDNWPFYESCRKTSAHWLIRACQDRRAALGHEAQNPEIHLEELARNLGALGGKTLEIQGHGAQGARRAKLLVSAGAVSLFAPWLQRDADPLRLWVVRVWEVEAPEGVEPVEWILLTSLPADTLEEALQMAQWYAWRWLIEEYHKCLKSGCAVEKRQLEQSDRLEALLGILVVIAVRLLALKQQVHQKPQSPALEHVDQLSVEVLVIKRRLKKKPQDLSLHEFWREVAKMGGFLGRKSDGEPGWQTLWRGWRDLQLLAEGAAIFAQRDKCG
jgi:hypothetical protein